MYKDHKGLGKPNPDQVIWHYFSLVKFLWFLDKSSLYLCRHDKFDDHSEGSLSVMDKQFFERKYPAVADFMSGDKAGCYYSCSWTKSDVDEYVLWNTFSSLKDGVAIQTKVQNLIDSLDSSDERPIYLSDVQYINYNDKSTFQKTAWRVNSLAPHFSKREYFKSEKELRMMYVDPYGKFDDSPIGIEVQVNMQRLIEKVYVAPFSYPWLKEIVSNMLEKYSLDGSRVVKSSI